MVNTRPAIVNEPVREAAEVFASSVYETIPFPVPAAPPVIVIQLLLLTAAQEHVPPDAVTITLPVELLDGNELVE